MIKNLIISLALVSTAYTSVASSFRFPEIGFCPSGGPPGWFNRMTGQQNNRRYYSPPPPMLQPLYPPVVPNAWQSPVRQQPSVHFPYNPAAY